MAADEIFILLLVLVFFGWIVAIAVRSRRQNTVSPDEPAPPETRPADVQPAVQPQRRKRQR